MPRGIGTYGSKVGRPPKRKKYSHGGDNPKGSPKGKGNVIVVSIGMAKAKKVKNKKKTGKKRSA